MFTFASMFYATTARPFEIVYVGSPSSNNTNGTSFTFNATPIGDEAPNRTVFIAVAAEDPGSNTPSGMTINGNAMSEVVRSSFGVGENTCYRYNLAVGTTADIVMNFSGSMNNCTIAVYAVYGADWSTVVTQTDVTLSGTDLSCNITLPNNGGYISGGFITGSGTFSNVNWSAATSNLQRQLETTTRGYVTGSRMPVVFGSTTVTITGTNSPASGCNMWLCGFGPL